MLKRKSNRPVCVHCRTPYGRRVCDHLLVRWDTPVKLWGTQSKWFGAQSEKVPYYTTDGPITPPPPYQGNGILVKESKPYLSADDNRMVMHRHIWDGQSWGGNYEPFCTLRCALDYARRAYYNKHPRET